VTTISHLTPTQPQSHWVFRLSIVLWAILLGMQCVWLVSAELLRPGILQMPTDALAAAAAARHSEAADRAASIGAIRGDLWAEAAFTRADSLWGGQRSGTTANLPDSRQRPGASELALRFAPHRSDVWLLVAGLGQRFSSAGLNPTEALKMSYYTGSSEMRLVPLRLRIAIKHDEFEDAELHEFISHDIRLLLAQKQIAPISEAYVDASAKGKDFLVQTVRDIDPSALDAVRTGPRQQETPLAD
jgi:hypothetical protein